jgi:amino acid permease
MKIKKSSEDTGTDKYLLIPRLLKQVLNCSRYNFICILESRHNHPHSVLKYTATMDESRYPDLDDLELEAVGYKREMPRQFSMLSLGALSFTLTCTWLGTGSSVGISLTEASSAGTLWTLPIAGIMTLIVSLGMAELASAYPVAGAQYYW